MAKSSFADSFIQGFEAGSHVRARKEKQALDEKEFEDRRTREEKRLKREEERDKVDAAARGLDWKMKRLKLYENEDQPVEHGPFPEGITRPKEVPDIDFGPELDALGIQGGPRTAKPVFADRLRQRKIDETIAEYQAKIPLEVEKKKQETAVTDEAENVVFEKDIPEIGVKKGQKMKPQELSALVSLHNDRTVAGGRGTGSEAEGTGQWLAQQVMNRAIDYGSLQKSQRAEVDAVMSSGNMQIPRKLTAKEKEATNNAQSGLAALDAMDKMLKKDETLPSRSLITEVPVVGAVARAMDGDASTYASLRREASDVITRLRTGAALNDFELKYYPKQVAQMGDPAETIEKKHTQLRSFYLGLSGVPVKLTSPDGKQRVTYQDLFDPKQRMGMRTKVDAGWTLEY